MWTRAYPPNVALVILTLFPGLVNSGGLDGLAQAIAKSLHTGTSLIAQAPILSNAAFAFGVVVAAELVRRTELRRLYITVLAGDAIVLALTAFATSPPAFIVLSCVDGLAAGMFVVIALPPMFTNFPEDKFPTSGGVLVPALFGATMLGPLFAGQLTHANAWRLLFVFDAVVIVLALVLALLCVGDRPPQQADKPVDWYAIVLAFVAIALIFTGALNLATHDWRYLPALVPFAFGVLALVALFVGERFLKQPLIPIKKLLLALPVIGLAASAAGNAVFVADQRVFSLLLTHVAGWSPSAAGLAVLPEIVMSIIAGLAFAIAVKTRWLPRNIVAGLFFLFIGSATLWFASSPAAPNVALAIGAMLCFALGAGLTVTPGLVIAGLSVESQLVARAVAAVELLRLTFGFVTSPGAQHTMLLHSGNESAIATFVMTGVAPGLTHAAAAHALLTGMQWTLAYVSAGCVLAIAFTMAMLRIYYSRPEPPDLRAFVKEGKPAYSSPPL